MRREPAKICSLVLALASLAFAPHAARAQQLASLRAPHETAKLGGASWLDFRSGAVGARGDLGFALLAINDEDWFSSHSTAEDRSVIKDLGALAWADDYKIPALEPLPALAPGERRAITVDSSGGTGKAWAQTTRVFAKVVVGHLYVVHVKRDDADFYAAFRVESHEQRKACTISWTNVPPPQPN